MMLKQMKIKLYNTQEMRHLEYEQNCHLSKIFHKIIFDCNPQSQECREAAVHEARYERSQISCLGCDWSV